MPARKVAESPPADPDRSADARDPAKLAGIADPGKGTSGALLPLCLWPEPEDAFEQAGSAMKAQQGTTESLHRIAWQLPRSFLWPRPGLPGHGSTGHASESPVKRSRSSVRNARTPGV